MRCAQHTQYAQHNVLTTKIEPIMLSDILRKNYSFGIKIDAIPGRFNFDVCSLISYSILRKSIKLSLLSVLS